MRPAIEQLKPYLQHKPECARAKGRHFYGVWLCEGERCTCGLDALLSAETPQEEAEVVGHACAHWFTQGGAAQFGELDWNGREPQNVDELISCILSVVRVAETPQAWQFTREELIEGAVSLEPMGYLTPGMAAKIAQMLREAAQHAPSSQAAETPRPCEDDSTCNPYVAGCGAKFCTYEDLQQHRCAETPREEK